MIDGILSKTVKRGFEFTLMVVGESGLGKSTMINSLFLTELYRNRTLPPVQVRQQFTSAGGSFTSPNSEYPYCTITQTPNIQHDISFYQQSPKFLEMLGSPQLIEPADSRLLRRGYLIRSAYCLRRGWSRRQRLRRRRWT